MPRIAHLDSPGFLQHVIVRGKEKRPISWDGQVRSSLAECLSNRFGETETDGYAWWCWDKDCCTAGELFPKENPGLITKILALIDK